MSGTKREKLDLSTPQGLEQFQQSLAAKCREAIDAGDAPMPEVVIVLRSGKLELYVCPVQDFAEKRMFQAHVKRRCLQMDVTACIATCDAWHVSTPAGSAGEARARLGDLEQHPERQECVMSVLSTPRGLATLTLPYTRTPEGIVWDAPQRQDYFTSGVVSHSSEWDPWQELRRVRTGN